VLENLHKLEIKSEVVLGEVRVPTAATEVKICNFPKDLSCTAE